MSVSVNASVFLMEVGGHTPYTWTQRVKNLQQNILTSEWD